MDNDKEELIRRRAYAIWEQEGCPEGQDRRHWEQASREMQREENQSSGEKQDLETEGTTHATSTPTSPPSVSKSRKADSAGQ
ncbi:DUF2934 domain-containing protein [Ensifer sp. IC4062]|nr:DUF2934 domain-containing protein [Ensifer sp. IC4062]MCA1444201.1 DUF2934 domain-containing protein [Ensifer sp. IC4062]